VTEYCLQEYSRAYFYITIKSYKHFENPGKQNGNSMLHINLRLQKDFGKNHKNVLLREKIKIQFFQFFQILQLLLINFFDGITLSLKSLFAWIFGT